jgi:hypothetical protein
MIVAGLTGSPFLVRKPSRLGAPLESAGYRMDSPRFHPRERYEASQRASLGDMVCLEFGVLSQVLVGLSPVDALASRDTRRWPTHDFRSCASARKPPKVQ